MSTKQKISNLYLTRDKDKLPDLGYEGDEVCMALTMTINTGLRQIYRVLENRFETREIAPAIKPRLKQQACAIYVQFLENATEELINNGSDRLF